MTVRHVDDMKLPIGQIIEEAGKDGVVIETGAQTAYAVMPLNDDLLDFLVEHSPALASDCQAIRERMRKGEFVSHEDVRRMLGA